MATEQTNIITENETVKPLNDQPINVEKEKDSFIDIANNLVDAMPEVQEHAIQQEIDTESEKLAQYSHLKDGDGNTFDPELHKTNKSGEPTVTKLGNLIKKTQRKPKPQKSTVGGVNVSNQANDTDQLLKAQSRASGVMTANLLLQVGIVAGGSEWYPVNDANTGLDEKRMLENAFADYFEATGKTDLPPNVALMVAVGAYALPRFTMPKTKTRLQKLTMGAKAWFVNRKLKKHGLKVKPTGEREPDPKQSATLEA